MKKIWQKAIGRDAEIDQDFNLELERLTTGVRGLLQLAQELNAAHQQVNAVCSEAERYRSLAAFSMSAGLELRAAVSRVQGYAGVLASEDMSSHAKEQLCLMRQVLDHVDDVVRQLVALHMDPNKRREDDFRVVRMSPKSSDER